MINRVSKNRFEELVSIFDKIDTKGLEEKINEIVYKLYELTDEEIKVVEKMNI